MCEFKSKSKWKWYPSFVWWYHPSGKIPCKDQIKTENTCNLIFYSKSLYCFHFYEFDFPFNPSVSTTNPLSLSSKNKQFRFWYSVSISTLLLLKKNNPTIAHFNALVTLWLQACCKQTTLPILKLPRDPLLGKSRAPKTNTPSSQILGSQKIRAQIKLKNGFMSQTLHLVWMWL